jgi:hypothetical protein
VSVHRSRLLVGLSVAFGAMTVALALAGAVYNLAILAPAALFGAVTYILWAHGTGRLAARIYRGVEQRARATDGRGRRRDSGRRNRRERTGGRRTRRTNGGQQQRPSGPSTTRTQASDVLGVEPAADQETIERAYRERVKQVHPDAENGDREAFKRVQDAYELLSE